MTRTVLITGSSSGFGLFAAATFAERGWRVFATMRDPTRAEALVTELARRSAKAEVLQLDVTRDDSVRAAVAEAEARSGGALDAVVNNAGYGLAGFVLDLALDEVKAQFETNFFGVLRVMNAALPQMKARGRGRIVNVSSAAAFVASPVLAAYCASKSALDAYSETAAIELKPFGVDVRLVNPGQFNTPIFRSAPRAKASMASTSAYATAVTLIEKQVMGSAAKAPHPQVVADAIVEAVEDDHVHLRRIVGTDAWLGYLMSRFVPEGVWQAMASSSLARMLGRH